MRRWLKALFPLLVFASSPAWAQIAFKQCVTAKNSATAATSIAVSITTTAGSLLWVGCREGSNNTTTITVSDSASQTWTASSRGPVNAGTVAGAEMFWIPNSASVTSVTCNFSASVGPTDEAEVCEWSGVATSSPVDSEPALSNNSFAASLTSTAMTTTNANDLLVYWVATGASATNWACGTGFTLPTVTGGPTTRMALCYEIVSATQSGVTTTTTWTTSNAVGGDFISFKQAAGGGGPTCPHTLTTTGAGC